MYRGWTARKKTMLDESAIDVEKSSGAYPVSRADVDPLDGCKYVLRLLLTYTILWLPVHCAICWLWSQSPGLTVAAVAVITIGAFLVAIAKWLGLEDLLQKLPLLLVLGLGLVGL